MAERYTPKDMMTPAKSAEYLGVKEATLRNWRSQGGGPVYFKHSRTGRITYEKAELDRYKKEVLKYDEGWERVEPKSK